MVASCPNRILVIEDDADIRESLRQSLEDEGYSVVVAENGQEGLRRLAVMAPPCLVLLDLMMPVMTGLEFLAAREKDEALAAIPVVLVTAYGQLADQVAGAVGVVRKPIDLDALLELVTRYCGEPPSDS